MWRGSIKGQDLLRNVQRVHPEVNTHGRSEGSRLFRKKPSCDIGIIMDLADLIGDIKIEMTLKTCSSFGKGNAGPFTSTHTPREKDAMLGKVFLMQPVGRTCGYSAAKYSLQTVGSSGSEVRELEGAIQQHAGFPVSHSDSLPSFKSWKTFIQDCGGLFPQSKLTGRRTGRPTTP